MPDAAHAGPDEVIITEALARRPSRSPDFEAENRALASLSQAMGENPESVLQRLVQAAMELTASDSAGISLLEPGGKHGVFRWAATAGAWEAYRDGTMPREASPCGEVIARGSVLLVSEPDRAFPALLQADPAIREALLAPFYVDGQAVGTVWVIKHAPGKAFEKEDARLLRSLAQFASVAHRVVQGLKDARAGQAALRESEARQHFLLKLSDALRPLADAVDIIATATRLLGGEVGASRAYYVEWREGVDYGEVLRDYAAPGLPSLAGRYPHDTFRSAHERISRGDVWVVNDVAADTQMDAAERDYFIGAGVVAWVDVPIFKAGRLQGALCLVQDQARLWSDREIALATEVADRAWSAVERARAEAALSESEGKYRTLFETMGQGYVLAETVRDCDGQPIDMRLIEVNPAYERLMGISVEQARGRCAYEILPGVDRWWLETCDRIAGAGKPERLEQQYREDGGWFEAWVYPRGRDTYEVLFEDITERKRAEEALRESEERHAFLLALGDAMRGESAAEGKIAVAAQLLGNKLDASRVLYAEYDYENGLAQIFNGWSADGAQPFPSTLKLEEFEGEVLNHLREGRIVRVDDVSQLEAESGYAAIANAGVQALLSPPLLIRGKLKFNVSIHQSEPRHWTDDEVALVQEVSERLWAEIVRARGEAAVRESEQHQRVLLGELQHRVRNTLGVVRSIARRTADNSATVDQMIAHFQGRLDAFSRVQAAVTRSADGSVDLASLIEDEMVAHAAREGEQLIVEGPDVALDSRTAERLSLAIHELTTNAVKHGALASAEGSIAVRWSIGPIGEGRLLHLDWDESGVELDQSARGEEGFGMELLLRSLPYDLRGETSLELRPTGLHFSIELPLPAKRT